MESRDAVQRQCALNVHRSMRVPAPPLSPPPPPPPSALTAKGHIHRFQKNATYGKQRKKEIQKVKTEEKWSYTDAWKFVQTSSWLLPGAKPLIASVVGQADGDVQFWLISHGWSLTTQWGQRLHHLKGHKQERRQALPNRRANFDARSFTVPNTVREDIGRAFDPTRYIKRDRLARKYSQAAQDYIPPPHSDGWHMRAESHQPWSSDPSPTSGPPLLGTGATHNLPLVGKEPKQEKQLTLPGHACHGENKRVTGKSANPHGRLCSGEWRSGVPLWSQTWR